MLGLLGMFVVLVLIRFTRTDTQEMPAQEAYTRIDDAWYLDSACTQRADVLKLGQYMDEKTGVLSIYHPIGYMEKDMSLVFRSKDVYTKVFAGKELLFETKVYDSAYYNRSPGNLWNRVDVHSDYAGKTLELQIHMVYDTSAITVDHIFGGEESDIVHSIVKSKFWAIVISLLMFLIGICMIVLDLLPYYGRRSENHQALYLGLYALLVGIWSLLETNVLQLYVEDKRVIQLIDNMVMITNNLPLIFFLDCQFHLLKSRLLRIFCWLQAVYIVLCAGMQLSGVMDLHDLLKGSWICSYMNDLLLFGCAVYFIWQFIKTRKMDVKTGLQLLGIGCLIVAAFVSVLKYTTNDGMDRAQDLRAGILGFIVCFGISSQLQMYRLLEQGLKYDIVRNLAYQDGLTGQGNRTAYLEHLDRAEQEKLQELGVVFLDINNLKKVNDQLGHDWGDRMIVSAAQVIAESFGKEGTVYRIGGDEFCVLIEGENSQKRYQEAKQLFCKKLQQRNAGRGVPFQLQVAHGFSVCKPDSSASINQAIAQADGLMYSDKAKLKEAFCTALQ